MMDLKAPVQVVLQDAGYEHGCSQLTAFQRSALRMSLSWVLSVFLKMCSRSLAAGETLKQSC
jgi:hypothetical protein